ncbi:Sister chromatid cohesion protein pds5 [Sesamum angolense]|uniref:Sister chromatid cohesion protein pds5 n=1 Tax=Sesamum angolense TaxID=2727404 RepID=A0AAE1WD89_9LAMI|nr:Sister chromatid cohesion protein pds5 [Sesamum angolense]
MAEAEKKEEEAKKVIAQIGTQLAASKICPNKSTLVKLLKQAASAFEELKQSESLKSSVKPLSDSLIKHGLTIKIKILGSWLASAFDIFKFLLSMFVELEDTASPYFSRGAKLLETVAKLQFCLVMLDTGCDDLILKMFKTFFSAAREDHPRSLINSMSSIITSVLEAADLDSSEKSTSQSLIDVILQNIIKERKGVASASIRLAGTVIQNCGEKLERCICQFLTSCILNRDAVGSVIKESYHEIILEIFQIAPQMLLSVIPCLTHELLTDQVDVRIKALNLIRKLLLHGQHFAREYPHVFIELLNRFSDKSAEVRVTALSCARALYTTNPSGRVSLETLSAIQGRLLDHDDKVRTEAVNVVCELAKSNLNFTSSDLITQAAERLRDKKVSVRREALKKLVELYQEYCMRCAAGITLLNEHIEEIPCKILMLCYEKNCPEFRPQSMELVLADLFPSSLSIEERTRHWIFMFSLFKPPHLKALKTILSQKRRLRDGLITYLDIWNRAEENGSREAERKIDTLVLKMCSCFPDPAKAKDCFQKLRELKDNNTFSVLQQLLRGGTSLDFQTSKDVYLRELGDRKALSEFIHLWTKCSFNIFGSEHIQYILDCLCGDEPEKKHLKDYQVQLLLVRDAPLQLMFREAVPAFLLEREIPFNEHLIEILAREGCHMSIKLSDIYSALEKVCLEGTRVQSKLAVSAIAALADTSEQFIFSGLCKTLLDSLRNGENTPTVLQSLGCMAQYSISTYEAQEKEITHYIVEEIFHQNDALASKDVDFSDETSSCCKSCKLKVFGLKALVRSFLPHKHTSLTRPINFLLDIIHQMLQRSGSSPGSNPCEHDEAFIRLAAANSVLRLSRKWDLHISSEIFRSTILMAKDHSPVVRRSFASKMHKLLSNHALPSRYACAFSFVVVDALEDLRCDALAYLEKFIREYGKGAQIHETKTMQGATNHPVYIVVFLIHVLAHATDFPSPECQDEKLYARFLSPLFVTVQALVNEKLFDGNLHLISNAASFLRSIFNAIKKAEDAVDARMTPVNAYAFIGSKADASFTKKLVSCLKIEVFGISSMGTKNSRQFYEASSRPSGNRHNKSNSGYGYSDNVLMNETKEQVAELHTGQNEPCGTSSCEIDTRGRQNQAMLVQLGSVEPRNEFSAGNKHERDANRNMGVKSSLACDSATTKPSLAQNEVTVSCSREEDAVTKCGSISAEPSILSRVGDQMSYSTSKVTYETGEVNILSLDSKKWEISCGDARNDTFVVALCGMAYGMLKANGCGVIAIKVWDVFVAKVLGCLGDRGVVLGAQDIGSSLVTGGAKYVFACWDGKALPLFSFMDGSEVGLPKLGTCSTKRFLESGQGLARVTNKDLLQQDLDYLQVQYCDHSHDSSSANDQRKAVDTHRCRCDSKQENLPKNGDICGRKVSQAVKRAKRCKDASGKSTSEVIDTSINDDLPMPRRTRRQKV